jgi:hypothetical protein
MTDVLNTNRLRISISDAKRVAGYLRRSRRVSFRRYLSSDHAQARKETNLVLDVFDWHFHIKWRPDGKHLSRERP